MDVVLVLEGDRYGALRLLRAAKNRFGSTEEVGRPGDDRRRAPRGARPGAGVPGRRRRRGARRGRGGHPGGHPAAARRGPGAGRPGRHRGAPAGARGGPDPTGWRCSWRCSARRCGVGHREPATCTSAWRVARRSRSPRSTCRRARARLVRRATAPLGARHGGLRRGVAAGRPAPGARHSSDGCARPPGWGSRRPSCPPARTREARPRHRGPRGSFGSSRSDRCGRRWRDRSGPVRYLRGRVFPAAVW